ncbi:MAG: hypothetical protein IRY99_15125 [Isosphaeraceae bacterium]|nr:hypothetical protein [Isosphaeraceae bacterium]
MAPTSRRPGPIPIRHRDPSDPAWKSVERVQRGRIILDVAAADLAASEERYGPFHPTTWYFRNALAEARRSWDRLRAEYGGSALEAALAEPPLVVLTLSPNSPGSPRALLIPIAGQTYRVERVAGTELAPVLWRLTRLPPRADEPYYTGRLADGSTHCDCAEWTFQAADAPGHPRCKHLAALQALGWI